MGIFGRASRKKMIIIIHGLANKPPKRILRKWCKKSIQEGFKTIHEFYAPLRMELVYWADLMHEKPQDKKETDKKSDMYFDDPYMPGNPEEYVAFTPSKIRQKILEKVEKNLDKFFFKEKSIINFDKIANIVVRNLFKDLDYYYNRNCPVARYRDLPARDAIRKRLAEVLYKYRTRDILLIAHSMGTIVSYDVLTQVATDLSIHTWITIGSPLGMPVIIKKILEEQKKDYKTDYKPQTPENIRHGWFNFSDLNDPVAINFNLADDYCASKGGIAPKDIIIYNNYEFNGSRSPHKLYGYLRAPEVAKEIYGFCTMGRPTVINSIGSIIKKIIGR